MNSKLDIKILFWLILYLYFPMLDIGGHRVILTEFYTYILFILNFKHFVKIDFLKSYLIYFVLYFSTIFFTAFLAGAVINNHDVYTLRNMAQFYMAMLIFYKNIAEYQLQVDRKKFESFILKSILILSGPAIIIYLQRLDLFGFRNLIISFYKPKFFFLDADSFAEFRYTSIFQDFFTEALYFTTLMGFIFYFSLKNALPSFQRLLIILVLLFVYSSQLFVSRTSLMISLLIMICILFYGAGLRPLESVKKTSFFIAIAIPLSLIIGPILINSKLINTEWALEGFSFLSESSSSKDFSSYNTMNSLIENFILFLKENPSFLFKPNHEYNLTITANPLLYTDSFYGQELYRFGIYGAISYLIFVFLYLKHSFKKHRMLFIIGLFFVILNYKGGNVFFMEKNVYMYAFIFSLLLIYPNYFAQTKVD